MAETRTQRRRRIARERAANIGNAERRADLQRLVIGWSSAHHEPGLGYVRESRHYVGAGNTISISTEDAPC